MRLELSKEENGVHAKPRRRKDIFGTIRYIENQNKLKDKLQFSTP